MVSRGKLRKRKLLLNFTVIPLSMAVALVFAETIFQIIRPYDYIFHDRGFTENFIDTGMVGTGKDFKIFWAGASTMVGEPFDQILNIPILTKYYLSLYGKINIKNEVYAYKGSVLNDLMIPISEGIKNRPNLFVLIIGHNEFNLMNSVSEVCWGSKLITFPFLEKFYLGRYLLSKLHLIKDYDGNKLLPKDFYKPKPLCDSKEEKIVDDFFQNLTRIATMVKKEKIPTIFIYPASNIVDFGPNRSFYRGEPEESETFFYQLQCLDRSIVKEDISQFELCRDKALEIDPQFAKLNFLIGAWYHKIGEKRKAQKYFFKALEQDTFPSRAQGKLLKQMNDVAHYNPYIKVLNTYSIFEDGLDSQHSWGELFLDVVHPSALGYNLMAYYLSSLIRGHQQNIPLLTNDELIERFNISNDVFFAIYLSRAMWFLEVSMITESSVSYYRKGLWYIKKAKELYSPDYARKKVVIPNYSKLETIPFEMILEVEKKLKEKLGMMIN